MKKKLLTILSCLIMFVCILTGCGNKGLQGGPVAEDTVYGNGGYVVRKGNYIYFANSYSTKTLSENDNEYGDETLAAIYRAKLNNQGIVETDEDGKLQNVEILAKQIAGFNNSGIYIFGDYIYYATPKTLKVKSDIGTSELLEGLVSFERIKLDGTGHKTLYSINTLGEDLKYSFNLVGNNVCLTVLNNKELTTVLIDVNKAKKKSTKTLAENVTSVVFPTVENITSDYSVSNFDSYVYFTQTVTIDNGGYNGTRFAKVKLDGSKSVEKIEDNTTKTLVSVKNNRLYYTEDSILYSTQDFEHNTQYSANSLTEYIVNQDSNNTDMGIVALLGNSMVYYRSYGEYTVLYEAQDGETVKLLYIEDNKIFYTIGNTLYSKEIYKSTYDANERNTAGYIHSTKVNISTNETTAFDYEQNYIFYYNTVEDSQGLYSYMHLVKHFATNEEGETFEQCVGVIDSSDIKTSEEE